MIAEYLSIGKVKTSEIKTVETATRGLSYREIAVAFRMAEVLGICDPFDIAPRYSDAFALARAVIRVCHDERVDAAGAEVQS